MHIPIWTQIDWSESKDEVRESISSQMIAMSPVWLIWNTRTQGTCNLADFCPLCHCPNGPPLFPRDTIPAVASSPSALRLPSETAPQTGLYYFRYQWNEGKQLTTESQFFNKQNNCHDLWHFVGKERKQFKVSGSFKQATSWNLKRV